MSEQKFEKKLNGVRAVLLAIVSSIVARIESVSRLWVVRWARLAYLRPGALAERIAAFEGLCMQDEMGRAIKVRGEYVLAVYGPYLGQVGVRTHKRLVRMSESEALGLGLVCEFPRLLSVRDTVEFRALLALSREMERAKLLRTSRTVYEDLTVVSGLSRAPSPKTELFQHRHSMAEDETRERLHALRLASWHDRSTEDMYVPRSEYLACHRETFDGSLAQVELPAWLRNEGAFDGCTCFWGEPDDFRVDLSDVQEHCLLLRDGKPSLEDGPEHGDMLDEDRLRAIAERTVRERDWMAVQLVRKDEGCFGSGPELYAPCRECRQRYGHGVVVDVKKFKSLRTGKIRTQVRDLPYDYRRAKVWARKPHAHTCGLCNTEIWRVKARVYVRVPGFLWDTVDASTNCLSFDVYGTWVGRLLTEYGKLPGKAYARREALRA